ncbi:DUF3422 family protein [Paracraurococcus ruber]|uniref:DUF3422 domain-containing protein n=1 Tax=Paracraurococcus ruber TaxID=77675 RepID=A0ABS1D1D1_9PROT|nr:DUF3422 domain-containing protein [Paracraurococcus ruber]MBK1660630.1 hypothetical protein [Paracraurococcus ruber]TDG27488.1 DUF3422 domain-containing protein [Paracraurococcus ruber]
MILPPSFPQRLELNDEVHARPPEAMAAPMRISYLALLHDPVRRDASWEAVVELARRSAVTPPLPGASHFSAEFGPYRLKWESHTEFHRVMFIAPGAGADPFAEPAIAAVPPDWVAALPGQLIVAAHVALLPGEEGPPDPDAIADRLFAGNVLAGGLLAGGTAQAYTDFRIHTGGFSRMLVMDSGMSPRQAGRYVQRLLEIDTYRMMALLALPMAREIAPFLTRSEQALAEITNSLVQAGEADEPELLERLTALAAEVERREAESLYRFSAADAYYELVQRRIAELREVRIEGVQTLREFTERRLAPAMNTCRAVAARHDALSRRVARATGLLSTRVDLTRERQNQEVLASMNRRAQQQLKLQQTVEGLSIAAVTYYVVGLVGYVAKGIKAGGGKVDPDLVTGVAIPVVAVLVALGLRQVRRFLKRKLK